MNVKWLHWWNHHMRLSFLLSSFLVAQYDQIGCMFWYLSSSVLCFSKKNTSRWEFWSRFFSLFKVFVLNICSFFYFIGKCITKPMVRHCQLLLVHRQQLFEEFAHFYPLLLGCYHFQVGSSSIKFGASDLIVLLRGFRQDEIITHIKFQQILLFSQFFLFFDKCCISTNYRKSHLHI